MLDPMLLDILACPRCKGPVTPDSGHTRLACQACRLQYRVDDGIPIMLIDEAESLGGEAGEDA
ncbi:MAG: Trm112 family protein [Candidatus Krumholzibacteriia bacterium]